MNSLIKFVLVIGVMFIGYQEVNAQNAYGTSNIVYDKTTKQVFTNSKTYLDYEAGVRYDPAVVATGYKNLQQASYSYYDIGYRHLYKAVVGLYTPVQAPPDTEYDIISDHYVIAYFYTTVVILDDNEVPRTGFRWFDPFGFSGGRGGRNIGGNGYGASTSLGFVEAQAFYLGTTGKAVITDPVCPEPSVTNNSCALPLKLKILSQYNSNGDLSEINTSQNVLIGATVPLTAVAQGGTAESKFVNWKIDDQPYGECANSLKCDFRFEKEKLYKVTAEVTQGSNMLPKSFNVTASLPTVVSSGTRLRVPKVYDVGNVCNRSTQTQTVALGCEPPTLNASRDLTSGSLLEAKVRPPQNFISNGSESHVEFYQVLFFLAASRSDLVGNMGTQIDCLTVLSPCKTGWYRDFRGSDFGRTSRGYVYDSSFTNNPKDANSRDLNLIGKDSPGVGLENQLLNGSNAVDYTIREIFYTYVTYYAVKPELVGPVYQRKALSKIAWSWEGKVVKSASEWIPDTNKPLLPAELLQPNPNDPNTAKTIAGDTNFSVDPERENSGEVRVAPLLTASSARWEKYVQPATSTTVRKNVAVFRPDGGNWYVLNPDGSYSSTAYGISIDIPVPGDFDGDGRTDIAVFRPDNPQTPENECQNGCVWYTRNSGDNSYEETSFGENGDVPAPADYDGDGKTDIAVFRPSTNRWYILRRSDGQFSSTAFGISGDILVPSDYDGDGKDDIAIWRPSTGGWYIIKSSDQSVTSQIWGASGDKPVAGDYDGDGKTDLAVWQPTGNWHILLSSNNQTKDQSWGTFSTDTPVQGNYDGDDKTDIAVWRPNVNSPSAVWYILQSSDGQMQTHNWGQQGDIPVPAAYSR